MAADDDEDDYPTGMCALCEAWDEDARRCMARYCRYDWRRDPEDRGDERYHHDKEEGRI